MKIPTNSRVNNLKAMIVLEEKRAALESQIAEIDEQFAALQGNLYGAPAPRVAVQTAKAPVVVKAGRKQRGALKEQILEALQAAGSTGVSVFELAKMLGTKAANIHSWFSVNVKKVAGLKKLGGGKYVLKGKVSAPAKPAKAVKVAKAVKAKPAKAAKPVKAAKAAKPAKAKVVKAVKPAKPKAVKKAKGEGAPSGRGELKAQILKALEEAGEAGVTIKDLSAKLGAKYKNLYIWFVTTGKKITEIQKVGPATYRLQKA